MSCAFLNCEATCKGHSGGESLPFSCPYVGLAHGLHAMAQPLTVLRGTLGASKLRKLTAAESARYMEISEKQVLRMGELLGCLQDFLDTAEGRPKSGPVDLSELFGLVLEDMSSQLRDWGGKINVLGAGDAAHVQGDRDQTERALRAALRAAVSISSPGGTLRVSIHSQEESVEMVLEDTVTRGKDLNFAERLNLSLVETNILGQGGRFTKVDDPLRISIALPAICSESREPVSVFRFAEARLSS